MEMQLFEIFIKKIMQQKGSFNMLEDWSEFEQCDDESYLEILGLKTNNYIITIVKEKKLLKDKIKNNLDDFINIKQKNQELEKAKQKDDTVILKLPKNDWQS